MTMTTEKLAELKRQALATTDGYRMLIDAADVSALVALAELGRIAMRFVDRAGDVHPGIDDAERICREFHQAMSDAIDARFEGRALRPEEGQSCEMTPEQMTAYAQSVADRAAELALPAGPVPAPVDGVHWDQFPAYLIHKCEGETITEDGLQEMLAAMLKDPDYIRIAAERASQAPAVAQPVAGFVYQIAGALLEEGWKDWREEFSRDAPPQFMIDEGKIKDVTPVCSKIANQQASLAQPVADERVPLAAVTRERVVAEIERVADVYGLDIPDTAASKATEELVWQVWRALCQPAEEGDKA